MTVPLRPYSSVEHLADGWIHGIGITASLIGACALVMMSAWELSATATLAIAVYGMAMVLVFVASASYHMIRLPKIRNITRRLDHAAIYLKIAGTYTPIAFLKLTGAMSYGLLGSVWAIALFGIIAKLFWPDHLVKTSYVLYLCAGWAGLAVLEPLLEAIPGPALTLLLTGGLIYTAGIIFHLWERLPFHRAIWHGIVLIASCCHFAAMYLIVSSETGLLA